MTAAALDLAQLTQTALEIAREAGALVLKGWRSRPDYRLKDSYADLVTEYDLASEKLIRQRMAERCPELAIVGEEQGGKRTAEPTWYVDPIDGTVNFAHGHPCFCVSLGLLVNFEPVAGVVVAPALATEWHGYLGGGVFRNGTPARVSDNATLSKALLGTGFSPLMRHHGSPEDNIDAFCRVMPHVRDLRRCGSAAHDLCLVADGTYDAFWERRLGTWDMAGGAALVLAAGGTISDLRGGPVDLTRGYILASNGKLHDALVELLQVDGAAPPLG